MKFATQLVPASLLLAGVAWQASSSISVEPVAYPADYRAWTHVKSGMISPTHKNFAITGGFQHVYANPAAMTGYRTRNFPERSVIVVDWLEMKDVAGAYLEGARRQVDPLPEVFGPRRSQRIRRVEDLPRVLAHVHRELVSA